jgi:hypothetical protein
VEGRGGDIHRANARKITSPQPSVRIFTQRHYSFNDVTGDKPRPELPVAPQPQATEKQLADAFGPFTGQAGTYEVSGNEITVRPVANPTTLKLTRLEWLTLTRSGMVQFDGAVSAGCRPCFC